ncbi:hypothetical protein [Flavobacterium sp. N3904]|uniref:hypothetical protein n=1 Tax=Flavobacterium sp. N3904 TaxID=2986835 RepID=UPI00222470B3|nr:hypothetical protein [Flavobacterium sp. N3904]
MKIIIFSFFLLFFCYCSTKDKQPSNILIVDKTLRENFQIKKLNNQREVFNFYEKMNNDTLRKKTSGVIYQSYKDESLESSKMNNCRSLIDDGFFGQKGNLIIIIGSFNGVGSRGFNIVLNKSIYTIKPYLSECSPDPKNKKTYKTIYQELVLDKLKYKSGDSLFGKIKFKIIEQNMDEKKEHIAEGYFRSLVK